MSEISNADRLREIASRIDACMNNGTVLNGHELLQVQFACRAAATELETRPNVPGEQADGGAGVPKVNGT